jgi:hypothetical protein
MTLVARSFALSARPPWDCFRGALTVRPSSTNRRSASGKLGLSGWFSAQRTMDACMAGEALNPINGSLPVIADFIGAPLGFCKERQTEHGPVGKFQDEASRPCRPLAGDGTNQSGQMVNGRKAHEFRKGHARKVAGKEPGFSRIMPRPLGSVTQVKADIPARSR